MKNLKFSRLFAAMLFVACFVFVGCDPQTEDPTSPKEVTIFGTWADDSSYNPYNNYDCKITIDYIETASYGKHDGPIYLTKTSETSGFIYYQFSEDIPGYDANLKRITVEGTKGKWCAVAYKNLTADSVQMCDAFKTYDFANTLSEAVELYTLDEWFKGIDTTFAKVN